MPKRKERSELEWYRSQIKELKKENRLLKRRLKELERSEHMFHELALNEPETEAPPTPPVFQMANCPDCGKGHMNLTIDLGFKQIYDCPVCGHRETKNG